MAIPIKAPNGEIVNFPDGTPDSVIEKAMASEYGSGVAPSPVGENDAEVVVTAKPKKLSWLDVPGEALANAPESAVEFGKAIVQPILHPIQTAKNFRDIGAGLIQHVRDLSPEGMQGDAPRMDTKASDAVGRFFIKRYGSIEGLKNTIATDPVGFAGDLSLVLTGGGGLAARAPGVVGTAAKAVRAAGAAVDPLAAAAKVTGKVGRATGEVASAALGFTTGAGGSAIKEAAKAGRQGGQFGETFRAHLRGQAPIEDVVSSAKDALGNMRMERSDAYRSGMVDIKNDASILDFTNIDKALGEVRDRGFYKGKVINPEAATAWDKIDEYVQDWKNSDPADFHTPEGLDALKKKIGDVRDSLPYGTPARNAANEAYGAVRGEITRQAPTYSKVMGDYENASKMLEDMEKSLSLGQKTGVDTAARKLQSIMRNNANTNYGRREQLGRKLEDYGATDLYPALAGQALSPLPPRGLSGMGSALTAGAGLLSNPVGGVAGLVATSPRVVGEAVHAAARATAPVAKATKAVSDLYSKYPVAPAAAAVGRLGENTSDLEALSNKYATDKPKPKVKSTGDEIEPEIAAILAENAKAEQDRLPISQPQFENLVGRVIHQESRGDPNAVSPKGAKGLMQVMSHTGFDPGMGVEPMRDDSPEENVRFGRDYLAALLKRYDDVPTALAAYNWGLGNVDEWIAGGRKGELPEETQTYIRNIVGEER
jgi:hypothetical protein